MYSATTLSRKGSRLRHCSNLTLTSHDGKPRRAYSFSTERTVGNTDYYGNDLTQMCGMPYKIVRRTGGVYGKP